MTEFVTAADLYDASGGLAGAPLRGATCIYLIAIEFGLCMFEESSSTQWCPRKAAGGIAKVTWDVRAKPDLPRPLPLKAWRLQIWGNAVSLSVVPRLDLLAARA